MSVSTADLTDLPLPADSRVDFVINVYERTYRLALDPQRFRDLVEQHCYPFALRTVLLSGITDEEAAQGMGDELVARGLADRVVSVAAHREAAYRRIAFDHDQLGDLAPFVDFAVVAVCLDGPDWVLHWDVEVDLRAPVDWVSPSLALMARNERVRVTNPDWGSGTLHGETDEEAGDFALGGGFSDQAFLARRSDLGVPIYTQRCTASWRYPMAARGAIFEARVDAYMRHAGWLRGTYRLATYDHPDNEGGAHLRADRLPVRAKRVLMSAAVLAARKGLLPGTCLGRAVAPRSRA